MTSTSAIRLTDHGLIRASGEDAASFLHNLLTNDITHLEEGQVRRAALCTAKGRMIASFLIWREGSDYLLQLSADILPGILKKLSMYILRSKVKLTDVSSERVQIGLLGIAAGPDEPMRFAPCEDGVALRLDAGRSILVVPADQAESRLAGLGTQAPLSEWHLAEIRAGIPRVVAATQEAFVPQMVNFEVADVGGVSFQKGCYPGQEIVARTHYLGKVKRRMVRARLDSAVAAGTDTFTPEAGDQHCGAVVLSAPLPDGGMECLLVSQVSETVHVASPGGPLAHILPLPYRVD